MARYAVVDNGSVVNVIEWDGASRWKPPAGCEAIPDPESVAEIGGSYDGKRFAPPNGAVITSAEALVAQGRQRLAELRERGWADLNEEERAEAAGLDFDLRG